MNFEFGEKNTPDLHFSSVSYFADEILDVHWGDVVVYERFETLACSRIPDSTKFESARGGKRGEENVHVAIPRSTDDHRSIPVELNTTNRIRMRRKDFHTSPCQFKNQSHLL